MWGNRKGKGDSTPSSGAGGISFDPPAEGTSTDERVEGAAVAGDGEAVVESDPSDGDRPAEEVVVEAAPVGARPKSKIGFGRGGAKVEKAPKPVRMKVVKTKKVKAEDEISLPLTVVIDFYQGVTKEREAEQIVRANIEKNFDAPNASYYYIQRWREGMAVEMQEGGGHAYLPEILAKLDEDEHAIVAVPMSNRVAQVRLDPETSSLETLLLLNNQSPPEGAFIAYPTRSMRPFDRRGSRLFVTGLAFLAVSVMAMLLSVGAFFLDKEAWALPYVQQTDVKILPAGQMPSIESALSGGADCVYKLEYAGQWNVTPGYDNGGVCGTTRTTPVAAVTEVQPGDAEVPPVVPGGVTSPTAAGAPGVAPVGAAPVGAVPPGAQPPVSTVPGAVPDAAGAR